MAVDAHNGGLEAQMEPWRVCIPVVADSHHFEEDPDPPVVADYHHFEEELDSDPDPN